MVTLSQVAVKLISEALCTGSLNRSSKRNQISVCPLRVVVVRIVTVHYHPTKKDVLPNFRHPIMEKPSSASTAAVLSDTDDTIIDVTVDSDFEGMTDGELNKELMGSGEVSSEEDDVNVTIREVVKPECARLFTQPARLASVVVVPSGNASITRGKQETETGKKNRNGSEKRAAKNSKSSGKARQINQDLVTLFAKASVRNPFDGIAKNQNGQSMKRERSVSGENSNPQPSKKFQPAQQEQTEYSNNIEGQGSPNLSLLYPERRWSSCPMFGLYLGRLVARHDDRFDPMDRLSFKVGCYSPNTTTENDSDNYLRSINERK